MGQHVTYTHASACTSKPHESCVASFINRSFSSLVSATCFCNFVSRSLIGVAAEHRTQLHSFRPINARCQTLETKISDGIDLFGCTNYIMSSQSKPHTSLSNNVFFPNSSPLFADNQPYIVRIHIPRSFPPPPRMITSRLLPPLLCPVQHNSSTQFYAPTTSPNSLHCHPHQPLSRCARRVETTPPDLLPASHLLPTSLCHSDASPATRHHLLFPPATRRVTLFHTQVPQPCLQYSPTAWCGITMSKNASEERGC